MNISNYYIILIAYSSVSPMSTKISAFGIGEGKITISLVTFKASGFILAHTQIEKLHKFV